RTMRFSPDWSAYVCSSDLTFSATTTSIPSDQSSTITATYNSTSGTATIGLVSPVTVTSLACAPTSLGQNASSTCTVTLSKAAPRSEARRVGIESNATMTIQ